MLVVDDSELFRHTAVRVLGVRGFDVVATAADVASAMSALHEYQPDAVLLDIHLPDGDGLVASSAMLAARPGVRVVLVSSAVDDLGAEQLRASGAVAFVRKDDLVTSDLEALLGGSRA